MTKINTFLLRTTSIAASAYPCPQSYPHQWILFGSQFALIAQFRMSGRMFVADDELRSLLQNVDHIVHAGDVGHHGGELGKLKFQKELH